MKKFSCVLCGIGGLMIGGLLGSYFGRERSIGDDPARSVAFEEDKANDTIIIYSYFVRPDGERVIDGKRYTISPTMRVIETYRNGLLQGFSTNSVHH